MIWSNFFSTIKYLTISQSLPRYMILIRYRGLPLIWDIISQLTQSVRYISACKNWNMILLLNISKETWFYQWLQTFKWKKKKDFLIEKRHCLERSFAWTETMTQACHRNFKIKVYLNNGNDMNRYIHFSLMLFDHWINILKCVCVYISNMLVLDNLTFCWTRACENVQ